MKGNIYIIKSKQTDKVYVGSTQLTLNERFRHHKTRKDCSSVEILKYGDAEIELIECYECENKEQLQRREGQYIRQYDCVNIRIDGRKKKEWDEDNKEAIAEYNKKYREDNKEKISENNKKYREENKDKIAEQKQKYREENKDKILEQHQKYREENKERINKKFDCECGGRYAHCNKAHHLKTKKHQDYLTKEI